MALSNLNELLRKSKIMEFEEKCINVLNATIETTLPPKLSPNVRKRGRPRKEVDNVPKRPRGRPPKNTSTFNNNSSSDENNLLHCGTQFLTPNRFSINNKPKKLVTEKDNVFKDPSKRSPTEIVPTIPKRGRPSVREQLENLRKRQYLPKNEQLASSLPKRARSRKGFKTRLRPNSKQSNYIRTKPIKRSIKTINKLNNKIRSGLGRWKAIDDLSLILNVEQCHNLSHVFEATKFSCEFSLDEISNRWNALLYNKNVSKLAMTAIRRLHPVIISYVYRKTLFSDREEKLLSNIKSTSNPTESDFQNLLNNNDGTFIYGRTVKTLQNHWILMKNFFLLCDQKTKPLCTNFSDTEKLINDKKLLKDQVDLNIKIELAAADRNNKRKIRYLEHQVEQLGDLFEPVIKKHIKFNNETFGILRGRRVRYLLNGSLMTFGRSTKDNMVDIDLCLEGAADKVSRIQGTIVHNSLGHFVIYNMGKRPIFVNANPILNGRKATLFNNAVLEIAGLRLIFLVNMDAINS